MTSNIGSPHLLEGVNAKGEIGESARDRVMNELRAHFRPEFLNRVDETLLFTPLQLEEVKCVVDHMIADLSQRLEAQKVELELSETARELIAREGFDPVYGARPLKRFIQREVETQIARALIAGGIYGGTVSVDVVDGGLHVETRGSDVAG